MIAKVHSNKVSTRTGKSQKTKSRNPVNTNQLQTLLMLSIFVNKTRNPAVSNKNIDNETNDEIMTSIVTTTILTILTTRNGDNHNDQNDNNVENIDVNDDVNENNV